MTADAALPCKHCGKKPEYEANGVGDVVWVYCPCRPETQPDPWGDNLAEAITRWDARQ